MRGTLERGGFDADADAVAEDLRDERPVLA
jgi:hypothetical protein